MLFAEFARLQFVSHWWFAALVIAQFLENLAPEGNQARRIARCELAQALRMSDNSALAFPSSSGVRFRFDISHCSGLG